MNTIALWEVMYCYTLFMYEKSLAKFRKEIKIVKNCNNLKFIIFVSLPFRQSIHMSWADNHLFVFILLPTRKRIDNYIMWVNGDHKVLGIWDEIKHLPQYKIKMN